MATEKKDVSRVNVKFVAGTDHTASFKTLSAIPGVLNVTQTFPDETDQELANLYLLDVETSRVKPALFRLRAVPGVAYVEEAAPRKLIRGVALHNA